MNIKIIPHTLAGDVAAIPSKSHGHRLLICGALAGRSEDVQVQIPSQDIIATRECLKLLDLTKEESFSHKRPVLDCRESGSTLRFLLPVAMTRHCHVTFLRQGRLATRPLSPLKEEMERHGCTFEEKADGRLIVTGPMSGGSFSLAGNVSSQFISGLLMALPLLQEGGSIHLTTPLESAPYVDLTLQVLEDFAISVKVQRDAGEMKSYAIPGSQTFISPGMARAEGDWSNAAFFLTANALGSHINCTGLDSASRQGDKAIVPLLKEFDKRDKSTPMEIDASQIPDLVPILAVKAALTPGETLIYNGQRLRIKESDRLQAMHENLSVLGGNIRLFSDGLQIRGGLLSGGTVHSFKDHRIVMSMAIAATRCKNAVTITDAQAVRKSYPAFFEDFRKLGGIAHEVFFR